MHITFIKDIIIKYYNQTIDFMHIFLFSFYAAGVLYAFFNDPSLILYFLFFVGGYIVLSVLVGGKSLSNRKKIMVGTWSEPSEGVIQLSVEVRVEKVQELINTFAKDEKPTLTHFVIKAAGQILREGGDVNGKIVFGKFIPYQSIDISCLVDIEGGKDLAMILIQSVDKKSIEQIRDFIKQKGSVIKKKGGDLQHKKRNKTLDSMPAFFTSYLLEFAKFCSFRLSLNIPFLSIKKNQFGSSCVTSLGMLGFQNATAPFSGFTGCTSFVSANAVCQKPVVEDGKIVVGKVMIVNFVVDHRYVDGGRCKKFIPSFKHVFQHPELYIKDGMKKNN